MPFYCRWDTALTVIFLVQDVMMVAGGRNDTTWSWYNADANYSGTPTVVLPDGKQCSESSLPPLPKVLEGFGMASRKNRYTYVCGGIERTTPKGIVGRYVIPPEMTN